MRKIINVFFKRINSIDQFIFKGFHFSFPRLIGIYKNIKSIRIFIKPDSNFKFKHRNINDNDSNKLFGISFGLNHHKNSIRITAVWDEDTILYKLYYYNNGVRTILNLFNDDITSVNDFHIKLNRKGNYFTIKSTNYFQFIEYDFNNISKWSYLLGFYFGGNNTAPHKMSVKLVWIIE